MNSTSRITIRVKKEVKIRLIVYFFTTAPPQIFVHCNPQNKQNHPIICSADGNGIITLKAAPGKTRAAEIIQLKLSAAQKLYSCELKFIQLLLCFCIHGSMLQDGNQHQLQSLITFLHLPVYKVGKLQHHP